MSERPLTNGMQGPHFRVEISTKNFGPGALARIRKMFGRVDQFTGGVVTLAAPEASDAPGQKKVLAMANPGGGGSGSGGSDVALVISVPTEPEVDSY